MICIANKELIGTLINKLRKEAHIKQTYLAERIGVKKTAVCQWEKGVTIPDIDKMMQLAVYFGVSVEELLEGKLKTESFGEFEKRNTKKNVDEYLEEMVKNFYELVPGWVDGTLDASDKKKFNELKERLNMFIEECACPLFYRKPVVRETINDLKGDIAIIAQRSGSSLYALDYEKYLLLRDKTKLDELEELVS